MFLLNSRLDHFSATTSLWRPFSRSYRTILPNSLTVIHSSALIYSIQPPVSVCGTGGTDISLADFLGSLLTCTIRLPVGSRYYQVRLAAWICLRRSTSTPFNLLFRQEATLSLLRLHFSVRASIGILTDSVIGLALRLTLSPRLTLIRLALIRNPESFGEGVSHPLYRYLYLHLLFRTLHQSSRFGFKAERNAPLPLIHSFGTDLIPVYSPCLISRLVSCYALFK